MGSRRAHVDEQIDSYLTGVLASGDERAFETHLLRCGACRAEAEAASVVAVALARVPSEAVDDILFVARPVRSARRTKLWGESRR